MLETVQSFLVINTHCQSYQNITTLFASLSLHHLCIEIFIALLKILRLIVNNQFQSSNKHKIIVFAFIALLMRAQKLEIDFCWIISANRIYNQLKP